MEFITTVAKIWILLIEVPSFLNIIYALILCKLFKTNFEKLSTQKWFSWSKVALAIVYVAILVYYGVIK